MPLRDHFRPPVDDVSSYEKIVVETKYHELILGQPLPTIPLWLAPNLVIPLELETTYEQACRDASIR